MIKKMPWVSAVLIICLMGCAHVEISSIQYPVYQYEAPTDFVYLKVLDTLNEQEGWVLSFTDKSSGIIEIMNFTKVSAEETDTQRARFIVKRIDREHTSVELDDKASVCRKDTCLKMLTQVNERISKSPAREKTQPTAAPGM